MKMCFMEHRRRRRWSDLRERERGEGRGGGREGEREGRERR